MPNNERMENNQSRKRRKDRYHPNVLKFNENVSRILGHVAFNHNHYLNMIQNHRVRYTLNNHNKIHNNMATRRRKNYTRRVKNAVKEKIYRIYWN